MFGLSQSRNWRFQGSRCSSGLILGLAMLVALFEVEFEGLKV